MSVQVMAILKHYLFLSVDTETEIISRYYLYYLIFLFLISLVVEHIKITTNYINYIFNVFFYFL